MPLTKSPTQIIVGALIGFALLAVAFKTAGLWGGLFLSALLAYEGWTLINKYPNDTISEIVWGFSRLPLVPFLAGIGFGWAIQAGVLSNPWLLGGLAILSGHFFFPRHSVEKETK